MMNWILHTTAGLLTRIAVGCGVFLILALLASAFADVGRFGSDLFSGSA